MASSATRMVTADRYCYALAEAPQICIPPVRRLFHEEEGVIATLGTSDENLHYSMDMEYYARAAFAGMSMHITPDVFAAWRLQPRSKTMLRGSQLAFRKDEVRILGACLSRLPSEDRIRAARRVPARVAALASP